MSNLCTPGTRFNIKMVSSYLTSIWATPMLKERRPVGRLFFNMGLPILVRRRLNIETGPSGGDMGHLGRGTTGKQIFPYVTFLCFNGPTWQIKTRRFPQIMKAVHEVLTCNGVIQ